MDKRIEVLTNICDPCSANDDDDDDISEDNSPMTAPSAFNATGNASQQTVAAGSVKDSVFEVVSDPSAFLSGMLACM